MKRKRLTYYEPQWSGPVELWARKYAHAQVWRVLPVVEYDDLLQEFYLIFMDCCQRYVVENGQHFQSLFMRCCYTRLLQLSKKRRERPISSSPAFIKAEAEGSVEQLYGETSGRIPEMELAMLVEDAPAELRRLIERFYNGEMPEYRRTQNGKREKTRTYLARAAGADVGTDMNNMVDELIGAA